MLAQNTSESCAFKLTLYSSRGSGIICSPCRADRIIKKRFPFPLDSIAKRGNIYAAFVKKRQLPSEMSESLVGFCHLMGIITFLAGSAGVVQSVHDLAGKALSHGLLGTGSCISGKPSESQSLSSFGTDFHRDLVGSAADTTGLNLQNGHNVFECFGKSIESIFTGLLGYDIKCTVDDLLSDTLLAVQHDAGDQTGDQFRIVYRICQNITFGNSTSSRHFTSLLHRMNSSVLESKISSVSAQRPNQPC